MNVTPDLDARFRAAALRGGTRRCALRPSTRRSASCSSRRPTAALPHLATAPTAWRRARAHFGARVLRSPLDAVRRELDEYFEGRRREFDLPLDLRVAPFYAEVLARARARPVRAHRDLRRPRRQGRPARAARAVGTVMNRNPIPIVLPCHRIVGANGSLTGYAGGLEVKRRLLQLEGATLASRRRSLSSVAASGGCSRFAASDAPSRGDARRPAELLPLPAARLPGRHRLALGGRGGDTAPPDPAAAAERARAPRRGDGFDLDARRVSVTHCRTAATQTLDYDTLVVAGGARYSYFGHDDWAQHAPELKSLEGALDLRDRILSAFEAAEVEQDEAKRAAWLTFVVVGAGPTGVEMAGQIAELGKDALHGEYRAIGHADDARPARRGDRPRARRVPTVALGERRAATAHARCHAAARDDRGRDRRDLRRDRGLGRGPRRVSRRAP